MVEQVKLERSEADLSMTGRCQLEGAGVQNKVFYYQAMSRLAVRVGIGLVMG